MTQSLAFVFPGQGSQQVGMLAEIGAAHQVVRDTFQEASDVLDYDLWTLIQEGPESVLNSTDKTQPALLTAGVSLWRLWRQRGGGVPSVMAGHSLGEYTAMVCSGALGFRDGVDLVRLRGEFMQQAVPDGKGAMAAILGLDDALVEQACEEAAQTEVVSAVNYNSPGQVVIAGTKAAVERAMLLCKEAGAKRALPLPVSVPSHCALMRPAAEQLSARLAEIQLVMPEIAVIQNVTAEVSSGVIQLSENLVAQLFSPVQWTPTVNRMAAMGVDTLIECGPGKVLSGLNKRIQRSLNASAINDVASFEKALNG